MKKKIYPFLMLFLISILANGQVLLTEDFSSGTMPPAGWTIDAHAVNWSVSTSTHAGGSSPEADLYYSPTFNGFSRLISPQINTTGQTSLTLSFRQYLDHYATPYTIGVATRSGGGSWTVITQSNPTGSFGPVMSVLQINNANVGAADFQFCFFFSGNSYNINDWYIDDISLSVSVARDAAVTALDVPKYSLGHLKIKGTLLNFGTTNLTTADVSYRIDQGTPHTSSLTGLNLPLGSTTEFAVADSAILTPGSYQLSVWVSNVNGAGPDLNPANDTMRMTLNVASASVPRKPFYEEFTSSTCSPCAGFNANVFTPFLNNHGDELTLIKYQMSWPSPGDPYYTEEGGVRRYFYGVSFVPDLYVDGSQTPTTSTGVNNGLTNSLDSPSFMDLMSHYSFPVNGSDTGVVINVEILPYVSGDLTLFAAVIEEVTYENVMSNGETEFHNVMMKMVPDAYGTPVTLVDGVPQSLELTADLSNTNIERWTDLMVIVWVQDTVTREFFQSGYGDSINVGIRPVIGKGQLKVFPNPASSYVTINGVSGIREVALIDNTGRTVLLRRDGMLRKIDLDNIPAGIYIVKVISDEGINTAKLNIVR